MVTFQLFHPLACEFENEASTYLPPLPLRNIVNEYCGDYALGEQWNQVIRGNDQKNQKENDDGLRVALNRGDVHESIRVIKLGASLPIEPKFYITLLENNQNRSLYFIFSQINFSPKPLVLFKKIKKIVIYSTSINLFLNGLMHLLYHTNAFNREFYTEAARRHSATAQGIIDSLTRTTSGEESTSSWINRILTSCCLSIRPAIMPSLPLITPAFPVTAFRPEFYPPPRSTTPEAA